MTKPKSPTSYKTAAQVREMRDLTGKTQAAAAAVIGASKRAWEKWESGERRMHPDKVNLFLTLYSEELEHEQALANHNKEST